MDRKRLLKNPLLWIAVALLLYLAFSSLLDSNRGYTQIPTSQAIQQLDSGNVKSADLADKEQQLKLQLASKIPVNGQQVITESPANATSQIYTSLINAKNKTAGNQPISFSTTVSQQSFLQTILIYMIPLALVVVLLMGMVH